MVMQHLKKEHVTIDEADVCTASPESEPSEGSVGTAPVSAVPAPSNTPVATAPSSLPTVPPTGLVNNLFTAEEIRQAQWLDYTSPAAIFSLLGILITLVGTITALLVPFLSPHGKAIAMLLGGIVVAILSALQAWLQAWKSNHGASGVQVVGRATGKLGGGR